MEVGIGPGDFVLDGDQAPLPKRGRSPITNFWPMSIVAKWLDGSRRHLARRWALVQAILCWIGTQLPSPKRGWSHQFLAHVCCGQMAAWIKMPLGTEVGLGPGDFVFDGDPIPQKKRAQPPTQVLAHVYCGQTAGWFPSNVIRSTRRSLPENIVPHFSLRTQVYFTTNSVEDVFACLLSLSLWQQ